MTGFRNLRVDRNGNPITTTNRETYYSWGAKYDANKSVTYFDGNEREFTPIDHNQWNDIIRTGVNQTYNLSMTNSSERNNVRLSYTFNDAKSMQFNSNNHKHNFNLSGDVYKRQEIYCIAPFILFINSSNKIAGNNQKQYYICKLYLPVSYTHLDVYKRQSRKKASGIGEGDV